MHFDVISSHIMKIYVDPMAAFKNHASDYGIILIAPFIHSSSWQTFHVFVSI